MSTARRHTRGREVGFTLLELLAAIVVLGLVMIMLSDGLLFGLQATRLTAVERRGDMLAIDHALRHMIALADPGIYPEPATLSGTADTLAFTTELPSGGTGLLQRADVVLAASGGRLVLRWRQHRHAEWFGSGPAWNDAVLSDRVERVEFAYLRSKGSAGWSPSWAGDRLPSLVRLKIVFAENSGERWPPLIVAPIREPIED